MIGGTMKTTSRFALAAAAGLFVGAMAFTPAKAADLGGDCCADLEERVAELEATTARKGNRVVSLEVSGRVNRAILVWDDGVDSDAFIVDNDHSSSRLGFSGSGSLKPGWTSGYDVVFNVQEADSSAVSQVDSDANDSGQPVAFDIRRARVYLESERFGRVTLGQGQAATDGTAEVDLGGGNYFSDPLYNTSFFVRFAGFDGFGAAASGLTWGDLGFNLDGAGRTNNIRYDSPSLYGFILSASFGEDDYADVALRFSREWNSIQFAAAVGYAEIDDEVTIDGNVVADDAGVDVDVTRERFSSSASVLHTPTGLFLTGTYSVEELDGVNTTEDEFYFVKGGVNRNFTGYGNTSIFLAYAHQEGFGEGLFFENDIVAPDFDYTLANTEVDRFAAGINQNFASAATDIYLHFEYNEADFDAISTDGITPGADLGIEAEDWFGVVLGSRVRF